MTVVLMLGSAPNAVQARDYPRAAFDQIVAINNAYAIRPDWDALIYPYDFDPARIPVPTENQRLIDERDFVPAQNRYGGFIYAGATMAFTAAYWALDHYRPRVIAVMGCDMTYADQGPTHFYGTGTPDPLRADISLRNLSAKSARLQIMAAQQGCAMVNLSQAPSRLVFARCDLDALPQTLPMPFDVAIASRALALEAALGYLTPTGHYAQTDVDTDQLDAIDALWLAALELGVPAA
jgi:hypothetical protein